MINFDKKSFLEELSNSENKIDFMIKSISSATERKMKFIYKQDFQSAADMRDVERTLTETLKNNREVFINEDRTKLIDKILDNDDFDPININI